MGIGDTKLSEKQVLSELRDKIYKLNGLNQILFVVGASKKFEKGDVEAFNSLHKNIFNGDKEITKFITIARTNFSGFANSERCKKDIETMANEGGEIAKIIELCGKKIIHVNNSTEDDDDLWMEKRNESRKILINHLKTCQEVYKPKPKASEVQERQKVHFSGTFHEVVYGGDIKAGDYANFGRVGVQNFKEVQTQHNYQGEERKGVNQSEQQSTEDKNLYKATKKAALKDEKKSSFTPQSEEQALSAEEISNLSQVQIKGIQKTVNVIKAEAELPSGLAETKEELKESDWRAKSKYDYDEIHPKGFLNKFDDRKTTELPTKLVDLRKIKEDDDLEELKADEMKSSIEENYAILSYS